MRQNGSSLAMFFVLVALAGCASVPTNRLSLYQRSMNITDQQSEREVLNKAEVHWIGKKQKIRVLHLRGTPYEMGFQHGRLMQKEIKALYRRVFTIVNTFVDEQMMDEIYDLMSPFIPREEKEEMRGLAHGADVPLRLVHWLHSIPEVVEYGPKKRFRKKFKATSCSNVAAFGRATADGGLYQLRVLDWIRGLGAQKYPVVLVHEPIVGNASVTFSYAGFIGCVSGMNDKQMAFGEMGYKDPPGEDLRGIPFIFLFRKLMREANSLAEAEQIIRSAVRTCSYVYVISDAKATSDKEKAMLVVADRQRVIVVRDNTPLVDQLGGDRYPALDDIVYGGAKGEILTKELQKYYGFITPKVLMEMTKIISLKSNMQNIVFKPRTLEAWISNAASSRGNKGRACFQEWIYFNFAQELRR